MYTLCSTCMCYYGESCKSTHTHQYLLSLPSLHEDLLLQDYQLSLEILSDLIRHAVYCKTFTQTWITSILFTYILYLYSPLVPLKPESPIGPKRSNILLLCQAFWYRKYNTIHYIQDLYSIYILILSFNQRLFVLVETHLVVLVLQVFPVCRCLPSDQVFLATQ